MFQLLGASVTLVGFVATPMDRGVRLTWQTAAENDNLGFRIWRRSASGHFEALAFVPGVGRSSGHHNYAFLDGTAGSGLYVYRLQQVSGDGEASTLGSQTVLLRPALSFSLAHPADMDPMPRRDA